MIFINHSILSHMIECMIVFCYERNEKKGSKTANDVKWMMERSKKETMLFFFVVVSKALNLWHSFA